MKFSIYAGVLYTGEQVLVDQILIIENNRIHSFRNANNSERRDSINRDTGKVRVNDDLSLNSGMPGQQGVDFDASLLIVAPAFIDLQVYGAGGKLFNNTQDLETLEAIHTHNLAGGTGSYQVTIPTSSVPVIFKAIDVVREALVRKMPGLLGLHLEGPFINAEKRGAHLAEFVLDPNIDEFEHIISYGKGVIKMMTIAPEFFNPELISRLLAAGIICSAGHSNATYDQATLGFNSGITATTHLYNAMSQLGSRAPGLTGAAMNHSTVNASIIADGIHCCFQSLEIAHKVMGKRLFLITDSVTASTDGPYKFFAAENSYVTETGILSGSALTMLGAVKNCVHEGKINIEDALSMASTIPANLMKLSDIGRIKVGALANLVVLDKDLQLKQLFIEGVGQDVNQKF